jgi:hypothetical protein
VDDLSRLLDDDAEMTDLIAELDDAEGRRAEPG